MIDSGAKLEAMIGKRETWAWPIVLAGDLGCAKIRDGRLVAVTYTVKPGCPLARDTSQVTSEVTSP